MTVPESSNRSISGSDWAWIAVQFSLLGIAAIGGLIEYVVAGRGFSVISPLVSIGAGVVFIAGSFAVLAKAARDLADNLTAAPTPVDNCVLVDHGIYGVVRHPMYLALLLGVAGYGLILGSRVVMIALLAMVPFFFAKARHEERLLRERVPGYDAYTRRVRRRFIPFLV